MPNKQHSICFSGHRLHKLTDEEQATIQARLAYVVHDCVQKGFHTFYVGMADGFDMLAAEEVVKMKAENKDIHFVAVIPSHNWRDFTAHEKNIFPQV